MTLDDLNPLLPVAEKLRMGIKEGRIPHAQYIGGISGGGALPLAVACASELLKKDESVDMFGGADTRAARLEHPDLHIVFPRVQGKSEADRTSEPLVPEFRDAYRTNPFMTWEQWLDLRKSGNKRPIISVHEASAINRKLALQSYEGGRTVVIIWRPEMMNTECSNKMLKLIEEPNPGTVLLFVGEDFDALLPTIKSRLQHIELPKPEPDALMDYLSRYRSEDEELLEMVVEQSEGSLGKALQLLGQEMEDMAPVIIDWLRLCYQRNVPAVMEWTTERAGEGRNDCLRMLERCTELFRAAFRNHHLKPMGKPVDEVAEFALKFSPFVNPGNAEDLMDAIDSAHHDVGRNGNIRIILLDLSFQVMRNLSQEIASN